MLIIQTVAVEFVANNIMYTVQTTNRINGEGSMAVHISTRPSDHRMNTITLEDDGEVKGWKVGDSIVIASTDFNFEQAERFTITSVDGNSVTIKGDLNFVHFGQKYEGLDMRAEVGMLTRNIKARYTRIDAQDSHKIRHIKYQCSRSMARWKMSATTLSSTIALTILLIASAVTPKPSLGSRSTTSKEQRSTTWDRYYIEDNMYS